MRRVVIISYTEKGKELNTRVTACLLELGDVPIAFSYKENFMSTDELLRQEWKRSNAIVFIGAMGIAVRHIACYLMDKLKDPAVLVADERGQFIVPVLSGHIGGGVELARELAGKLGSQPVITTATDVAERFAVDVFAARNHLYAQKREQMKRISAALLRGESVDLWSGIPLQGEVPEGVRLCSSVTADPNDYAILLGAPLEEKRLSEIYMKDNACVLKPLRYILGIGCKKGKTADELEALLDVVCDREGIDKREIGAIASVDRKRKEAGIWELSRRLCVPYTVFSPDQLMQVEEEVSSSAFVKRTLGVDNVCERSACCLAGEWTGKREMPVSVGRSREEQGEAEGPRRRDAVQGEPLQADWNRARYRLAVEKQALEGMTLALVEFFWQ